MVLFCFTLICYRINLCCDGCFVSYIALIEHIEILIKGVHQRYSSGDIYPNNFVIRKLVELLNQSTKGISVSNDKHALTVAHLRLKGFSEIRPSTGNGVFEAFGQRHFICRGIAVRGEQTRDALIIFFERWRTNIEAAAPDLYLLFAVFCSGFCLVLSLKSTVVTFV